MNGFQETVIRGRKFSPGLFCAPMAGFTHSAMRRLVDDFGGCGALFTEMLSAKLILDEDVRTSPFLRRHPGRTPVIYQLMVDGTEPLEQIIAHLSEVEPGGIDINMACNAPSVRNCNAGSRLFDNIPALTGVLQTVRRCWPGQLTVKIRLGHDAPGWEQGFNDRIRIFEDCGVDAITLHPRFFEDRFRRRARYEAFSQLASLTKLPLIASGDITGHSTIREHADHFNHVQGIMIGRLAIVQPWIFSAWNGKVEVDYAGTWLKMFNYICEDFSKRKAVEKIKAFTGYYARNFSFGHQLQVAVNNAITLEFIQKEALSFFETSPAIKNEPTLSVI